MPAKSCLYPNEVQRAVTMNKTVFCDVTLWSIIITICLQMEVPGFSETLVPTRLHGVTYQKTVISIQFNIFLSLSSLSDQWISHKKILYAFP
jgi:hypothetical protein